MKTNFSKKNKKLKIYFSLKNTNNENLYFNRNIRLR